jgi:hypothetical protein
MEKHPDKYKQLQVILTHNINNRGRGFGQDYLVVSNDGFWVYKLLNVDYSNGVIKLILA